MREILFRAKRHKDYGEGWVYGVPFVDYAGDCIMKDNATERVVDPDTVGQYTSLTDKNGTKIFEGDIVDFFGSKGVVAFECGAFGVVIRPFINYDTMQQRIYDLTTNNTLYCCYNDNFISLWEIFWNFDCEENCCHVLEVIGNIHDNPELLEVRHAE